MLNLMVCLVNKSCCLQQSVHRADTQRSETMDQRPKHKHTLLSGCASTCCDLKNSAELGLVPADFVLFCHIHTRTHTHLYKQEAESVSSGNPSWGCTSLHLWSPPLYTPTIPQIKKKKSPQSAWSVALCEFLTGVCNGQAHVRHVGADCSHHNTAHGSGSLLFLPLHPASRQHLSSPVRLEIHQPSEMKTHKHR